MWLFSLLFLFLLPVFPWTIMWLLSLSQQCLIFAMEVVYIEGAIVFAHWRTLFFLVDVFLWWYSKIFVTHQTPAFPSSNDHLKENLALSFWRGSHNERGRRSLISWQTFSLERRTLWPHSRASSMVCIFCGIFLVYPLGHGFRFLERL